MRDNSRDCKVVNRRRLLKSVGIGGVVGLAGCVGGDGDDDTDERNGTTTGTTTTSTISEITVGLISPTSGSYAFIGNAQDRGAELAAKGVEEELGVTINIEKADSEFDPQAAVNKAQRLVTKDDAQVLVGGAQSAVSQKLGQWATENGVMYMSPDGAADSVSGESCAKYMFGTMPSVTMLNTTGAKVMAQEADSWFLIFADYVTGRNARDVLKNKLQEEGAEVPGSVGVPQGNTDFTRALNEVQSSEADGVGVLVTGQPLRTCVKQYVNRGMHENFQMGGPAISDTSIWGFDKEIAQHIGVWGTWWSPAVGGQASEEFRKAIKNEYDTTPAARDQIGYTAMDQILRAVVRADGTEPENVRNALEGYEFSDDAGGLKEGKEYFRACDHRAITPTYGIKALPKEEMQDEPYKVWLEQVEIVEGDEVARSCDQTGCNL